MSHLEKLVCIAATVLFYSCSPAPSPLAADASKSLPITRNFQAKGIETPQISNSLVDLFSSSQLKTAVKTALSNNPSLLISQSQIREAELNLKSSKTAKLPFVTASGTTGRTGSSGNSSAQFSLSANASWEIDIWKRIETSIIASENDLQIAKMLHESARESVAAQVMQAWVLVLTQQRRVELSRKRLASFERTLKLVNRKFENGTSDLGAVTLAEADIENTHAEIADRIDSRDQASRNLASLIGNYPKATTSGAPWPSLKRSVRPGTPASLLRRRPDLQVAYLDIVSNDL